MVRILLSLFRIDPDLRDGGYGAVAFALVLFILLVIIFRAGMGYEKVALLPHLAHVAGWIFLLEGYVIALDAGAIGGNMVRHKIHFKLGYVSVLDLIRVLVQRDEFINRSSSRRFSEQEQKQRLERINPIVELHSTAAGRTLKAGEIRLIVGMDDRASLFSPSLWMTLSRLVWVGESKDSIRIWTF